MVPRRGPTAELLHPSALAPTESWRSADTAILESWIKVGDTSHFPRLGEPAAARRGRRWAGREVGCGQSASAGRQEVLGMEGAAVVVLSGAGGRVG